MTHNTGSLHERLEKRRRAYKTQGEIVFYRKGISSIEELTLHIATPPGKWPLPKWLDKLLTQEDWCVLGEIFDHVRHVGNIAVCEPYGVGDKTLGALLAFCGKHGLRFSIIGKSNHYPSQTIRIVIWRPRDEAQLSRVEHWHVPRG